MCQSPKGVWAVVNEARGTANKNSVERIVSLFQNSHEAALKTFVKSLPFPRLSDESFPRDICDETLVQYFLSQMRTDKSPGSDGVHTFSLKVTAITFYKPLCFIFNVCFSSGVVLTVWKIADVRAMSCSPNHTNYQR